MSYPSSPKAQVSISESKYAQLLTPNSGGGLLATSKTTDDVKMGENIIVGGLCIQIVFFGFFMVVTLIFHTRIHKNPTQKSMDIVTPWKTLLYVLYASSLFILVRSAFRVAEYIAGRDSSLQGNEVYIYIFDALLMALVSLLFNVFHPSRVINPRKDASRIASYDGYLMENQRSEDMRPGQMK